MVIITIAQVFLPTLTLIMMGLSYKPQANMNL